MSKMINSREGGKRKGKNVSEVEMVQTSDGGVFKDAQKGGLEDGYAQPKGVQTRQAIAKHLAAKLKIPNEPDIATLQAYEKELRANELTDDSFWV